MIETIQTEAQLEDILTRPRPVLVEFIRTLASPLIVLGAGGKMGPTLAVLARRAAQAASNPLEIIAISRFSDDRSRQWLEGQGIRTFQADLLDRSAVQQLPDSRNIIYLVGLKFGTAQNPSLTWAVNTIAPALVAERYAAARIAALSTGNVYPFVPVSSGGASETHPLTPMGEYANAAVARERLFEYFSQKNGTPIALIRLNYAVELRYGVLVDIARKVFMGEPIELTQGYFNCIWQADANEMIIRALGLASAPATAWNLTGPSVLSVRQVAERFAKLFQRPVQLIGEETDTALLSNPTNFCAQLGVPPTPLDMVIGWIAHWVQNNGRYLNKPTHFEVRDGAY